ncbi:hypothetical protein R5H32_15950 [Defluviimonas sp. D31]|uniref:hypothetical protein n=1 Tax=Defluviimonas sp. D31 TaxID=3083253 RepID=UPI00296E585C|nr:hypothetical protein [Defluviimonas sp. D31]MDW4550855.1 hypothetical protein [Defluviimonas sp. D31]
MPATTRDDFLSAAAAALADNTTGAITAAILRAVLGDLAASAAFPEDLAGGIAALGAAQSFTAGQAVTPVGLDFGAYVWTDCAAGNLFTLTLIGSGAVLYNPENLVAGGTYVWRIAQDATGGRLLSFGSVFKFPGGAAPALSAAPNAVDLLTAVSFDGATLLATLTKDYK